MFFKLRERIGRFLHPFHSIASSLDKIASLYELEMAAHVDPKTGQSSPIRLVTEAPARGDTEVIYTGESEREKVDIFADAGDWE